MDNILKQKTEFIKHIKKDLTSNCFNKRNAANTALYSFDLSRANTQEEIDNAQKEWEFRMWAYECQYGIKDARKMLRKKYG